MEHHIVQSNTKADRVPNSIGMLINLHVGVTLYTCTGYTQVKQTDNASATLHLQKPTEYNYNMFTAQFNIQQSMTAWSGIFSWFA